MTTVLYKLHLKVIQQLSSHTCHTSWRRKKSSLNIWYATRPKAHIRSARCVCDSLAEPYLHKSCFILFLFRNWLQIWATRNPFNARNAADSGIEGLASRTCFMQESETVRCKHTPVTIYVPAFTKEKLAFAFEHIVRFGRCFSDWIPLRKNCQNAIPEPGAQVLEMAGHFVDHWRIRTNNQISKLTAKNHHTPICLPHCFPFKPIFAGRGIVSNCSL